MAEMKSLVDPMLTRSTRTRRNTNTVEQSYTESRAISAIGYMTQSGGGPRFPQMSDENDIVLDSGHPGNMMTYPPGCVANRRQMGEDSDRLHEAVGGLSRGNANVSQPAAFRGAARSPVSLEDTGWRDFDSTLLKESQVDQLEPSRQPESHEGLPSPINNVYVDVNQMSRPHLIDQCPPVEPSVARYQQACDVSALRNVCMSVPVVLQPVDDSGAIRGRAIGSLRNTLSSDSPEVANIDVQNVFTHNVPDAQRVTPSSLNMNIPPSRPHDANVAMAEQQFSFMSILPPISSEPLPPLSQHRPLTDLSTMPVRAPVEFRQADWSTSSRESGAARQACGQSQDLAQAPVQVRIPLQKTTPGLQPVVFPTSLTVGNPTTVYNRFSASGDESSGYLNMSPVVQIPGYPQMTRTVHPATEHSAGVQQVMPEQSVHTSPGSQQNPTFGSQSSSRSLHSRVSDDTLVRKLPLPLVEFLADHLSGSHSRGWQSLLDQQGWNYDQIYRFGQRHHEKGPFYSLLREAGFERLTVRQLMEFLDRIPRRDVVMDFEEMIEEHNARTAP